MILKKGMGNIIYIGIGVLFIIILIFANMSSGTDGRNSNDVFVTTVKKGDMRVSVYAPGVIEPSQTSSVYFDSDVRIAEVVVEKNQEVKAGDRLFTYDVNTPKNSDINGVVSHVNIVDGIVFGKGQPAVTVIGTDNLRVRALVRESDILRVAKANKVIISSTAFGDTQVEGKVINVSPIASRQRTLQGEDVFFEVLISINTKTPRIRAGLSVNCEIITDERKNILTATYNTIREINGEHSVFVVEGNRLSERKVEVGAVSGITVELSGEKLKEKDVLVVDPRPEFLPGMKVNIINMSRR